MSWTVSEVLLILPARGSVLFTCNSEFLFTSFAGLLAGGQIQQETYDWLKMFKYQMEVSTVLRATSEDRPSDDEQKILTQSTARPWEGEKSGPHPSLIVLFCVTALPWCLGCILVGSFANFQRRSCLGRTPRLLLEQRDFISSHLLFSLVRPQGACENQGGCDHSAHFRSMHSVTARCHFPVRLRVPGACGSLGADAAHREGAAGPHDGAAGAPGRRSHGPTRRGKVGDNV